MRSKNEVLYKQNEELGGRLGAEQVKNEELTSDVTALRAETIIGENGALIHSPHPFLSSSQPFLLQNSQTRW
ncbi:hypothetical protein Godav_013793 [Gossypium davidsonii]|uniref:Uncharacterized protein n=1 Tax=Gossypium davidsonii TaxID=34287 RepID=A0A7J8RJ01_GOSDV|nr:hypothetical protein [Gossypium davidsonii]